MKSLGKERKKKVWVGYVSCYEEIFFRWREYLWTNKQSYFYHPPIHKKQARKSDKKIRITVEEIHQSQGRREK